MIKSSESKASKINDIIKNEYLEAFKKLCVPNHKSHYWKYENGIPFMQKDKQTKKVLLLNDNLIQQHIDGKITLGWTPFINDSNVLYGVIDFDVHAKTEEKKKSEKEKVNLDLEKIKAELNKRGITFIINSSGSDGKHLRVYGDEEGTDGKVMQYLLKEVQQNALGSVVHEIYPKQHKLSDTEEGFGSQTKAVLGKHPKTGMYATLINDKGSITTQEESLKQLVEFAKLFKEFDPIDFEVTKDIEKKYEKKSIENIEKQEVPKYCAGIELIASKEELPSSGEANRHSYLDGNVKVYCEQNNKNNILKGYMKAQSHGMTAFNGFEKWKYSCATIYKYLKNNKGKGIEKWKEHCEKCIHNEVLIIDERIENRDATYLFRKDSMGIIVKRESGEAEEFKSVEILDFDKITKIHTYTINPFNPKNRKERKFTEIEINNEQEQIKTPIELKNIIKKAKRTNGSKITRSGENAVEQYIAKLPTKKRKETTCNCFAGGVYLDENNNYITTQAVTIRGSNGGFEQKFMPFVATDLYRDFINLKVDITKKNKCVDIINNYPREKEEGIRIKLIDALGNAGVLKAELKNNGINIFPITQVVGDHNVSKSQKCYRLISKQWNTEDDLTANTFKGRVGARLKPIDNNCFPRYFDEVTDFENNSNEIKNSATSGTFKIKIGRKDGGVENYEKYFPIIISCNEFKFNDPAEQSRYIVIDYNFKGRFTVNEEDHKYVFNNIVHLGKWKYNSLKKFNFKKIIKAYFRKYSHLNGRDKEKIIYVKIGEMISNKAGILPNITIPDELILNTKSTHISDSKSIVIDCLRKLANSFFYRTTGNSTYNLHRVLNGLQTEAPSGIASMDDESEQIQAPYDETKYSIVAEAERLGIRFNTNMDEAYITTQSLEKINEDLIRRRSKLRFNELTKLVSILELNKDKVKVRKTLRSNGKETSTRCVTLMVADAKDAEDRGLLFEKEDIQK